MLRRLTELEQLAEPERSHIISVLDGFLQSIRLRGITTF